VLAENEWVTPFGTASGAVWNCFVPNVENKTTPPEGP
jgi:hypothetical protein